MKKFLSVLAVLVFIVAAGFGGLFLTKTEQPSNSFAAVSGPDNYNHLNFYLNHTDGGEVATFSATAAQPLAPNLLSNVSRIDFTPNITGITLTLPATTTITSLIPKVGDTQSLTLCNASTTPGVFFTVAFGTGLKTNLATSTLTVNSTKCASITFQRKPNSDIDVLWDVGF